MKQLSSASGKNAAHAGMILLVSVAVTLFLFFIDEGFYDFRWMKRGGNWIAFAMYVAGLTAGQVVLHERVLRRYDGRYKPALTYCGGTVAGLAALLFWLG